MLIYSLRVVLLSAMLHTMGMETSVAKDFDKADRYEGRKIHRLWRELEQGMFPFDGGARVPRPVRHRRDS